MLPNLQVYSSFACSVLAHVPACAELVPASGCLGMLSCLAVWLPEQHAYLSACQRIRLCCAEIVSLKRLAPSVCTC